MLEEGNIVYFDPFYFKNGNTAKPKYFVVLKKYENKNIIASLPTRKDSIPQKDVIEDGCLDLPDINLNCFVISPSTTITECGKCFECKTHLYGHQIDTYEVDTISEIYPIEGTDYIIWGRMKSDIFQGLLHCFKTSKSIKRKYKNILNQ